MNNVVAALVLAGGCAGFGAMFSYDHLTAAVAAGGASLFTFYIMVTVGFKYTKG